MYITGQKSMSLQLPHTAQVDLYYDCHAGVMSRPARPTRGDISFKEIVELFQ